MFRRKKKKASENSLGMLLLAAFIVFDAGLALLAWQRWEKGKVERQAVVEERELMVVPASEEPVLARVTEIPKPLAVPLVGRNSKGEKAVARMNAYSPHPNPLPQAGEGARHAEMDSEHLPRATEFYRGLKRQTRFHSLVNAWTEEFVKHRELRALNHRYHQDQNAAAFILGAVRSPEFLHLLGSFAARADLQGFMMEMTGSTDVSASAQALMRDGSVAKAMTTIRLPGMPDFAAIGRAAQHR